MFKIGCNMNLYNFKIDISHCQPSYEDWYEDLPVELSDGEFQALCIAQKNGVKQMNGRIDIVIWMKNSS